ncbi:MAG: amino acid adenylation domain-containing protein [Flavobacterium sp.]
MKHLLSELEKHNIQISLNGDNLDLSFDGTEIDPILLDQIRANKPALIDYFKKYTHSDKNNEIESVAESTNYELSDTQRRLWVLSQFENASNAYNMPSHIFMDGIYDPVKFGSAIAAVLERHEILRTVFRNNENGEIRQWILPLEDLGFQLEYINFSAKDQPVEKAQKHIDKDSFEPFDLENGPLVRASLLQVSANTFIFYYNMHHIISDGWSLDILARDVMAYYNFYQNAVPLNLPELKIQYKDYAAWQFKNTHDDSLNTSKSYWSELLTGELPVITLPTQKKRPIIKTYSGHKLGTQISSEHTQALRIISKETGGSLFMGLLSVWKILMYRYTLQEDLIIGTAVAGRNHTDLEDQIGFYVNTLPLRNKIDPVSTFYDTLVQIRQTTLEAYNNQMYPFDRLVDELSIQRDPSRNPLLEIMLTLQNVGERQSKTQLTTSDEILDLGDCKSKFDLSVDFEELEESLFFSINYNTDVYEHEMISELIRHFKALLQTLLQAPKTKIKDVIFLSSIERDNLLLVFNDTTKEYPKDKNFIDYFEEQAAAKPEKTALIFEDDSLTYKQLEEKTRRLANYFIENGIQKQLIPICIDRSLDMIIGVLGILRSGNAYVPIEGSFPLSRIQYILNDVQSDYVVTTTSYASLFATVKVINLDTFQYDIQSTKSINIDLAPNDLAYCIFTSGTTGVPKGVLNEHGALLNRLLWMRDDLQIDSGSVLLQKTPYIFDVSVWELIMPLMVGCELVIAKPDGHKDPAYLQDLIQHKEVTIIHFVPSMFAIFLEYVVIEKCKSLLHIICSGEALPIHMIKRFKQIFQNKNLHNYYGPTEAAIDVTAINLSQIDLENDTVSIGKAMANTKIYIVDKSIQLQPLGAVGELLIGGIQVARGYLNKPDLTEEKFIASPFIKDDRLYKTGDLARWLPDGSITYIGRKDNQVKINGYRIELQEIEEILITHEEIKESVILVKERDGNKYLAAYYTSAIEQDTQKLKSYLQNRLPAYMIPEYFKHLDELPLTVNGKLDKKFLPEIEVTIGNSYIAPSGELEEQLVVIWADVLKINEDIISVNRNFFELGGNSMDIIRLNNKINIEFNSSISVTEMFRLNTILEMKEFILKGDGEYLEQVENNIEETINEATENLRLLENI